MSGSIGFQPIDLYVNYAKNETKLAAASVVANGQEQGLTSYFQKHAATIATPAALLKDYKALSVVLGAFGLQGSINDTAILRKLMTQNPKASTSLAQTLGNTKYQLFAQALSDWKTPPFATASSRAQIISSYATNQFETQATTEAPGLGNALYFTREAHSLKSIIAVQSDSNLLAVAVTAAGLPLSNFQELGFDQQTSLLKSKLNIANLQKPADVTRMAEQYLVQQGTSGSSTPAPGSVASLYSDTSSDAGDTVLDIIDPSANLAGSDGATSNTLSLFA